MCHHLSVCRDKNTLDSIKTIQWPFSGRPGTLSIQTSRQTARNHFYRCRGHQGNKTAVNQHDCGFLMPSQNVTDV